jgi:hypothetical protein
MMTLENKYRKWLPSQLYIRVKNWPLVANPYGRPDAENHRVSVARKVGLPIYLKERNPSTNLRSSHVMNISIKKLLFILLASFFSISSAQAAFIDNRGSNRKPSEFF